MRPAGRAAARVGTAAGAVGLDAARARAVALDLLSRRPWSRRELGARLRRRGAPAEVAAAVVADLERRGYVDDRAFAAGWVESRARARGLGRWRLREELLARGVAPSLVEGALRAGCPEPEEEARARAVALRRWAALRRGRPEQGARRLHDYLLRRGFAPELVRRVVRETAGVAWAEG